MAPGVAVVVPTLRPRLWPDSRDWRRPLWNHRIQTARGALPPGGASEMEDSVTKRETCSCKGTHTPTAGLSPRVPLVRQGLGAEDWRWSAVRSRALSGNLYVGLREHQGPQICPLQKRHFEGEAVQVPSSPPWDLWLC